MKCGDMDMAPEYFKQMTAMNCKENGLRLNTQVCTYLTQTAVIAMPEAVGLCSRASLH